MTVEQVTDKTWGLFLYEEFEWKTPKDVPAETRPFLSALRLRFDKIVQKHEKKEIEKRLSRADVREELEQIHRSAQKLGEQLDSLSNVSYYFMRDNARPYPESVHAAAASTMTLAGEAVIKQYEENGGVNNSLDGEIFYLRDQAKSFVNLVEELCGHAKNHVDSLSLPPPSQELINNIERFITNINHAYSEETKNMGTEQVITARVGGNPPTWLINLCLESIKGATV